MSDDYLWDKSGEPDSGVQRLERELRALRHGRPAPDFPMPAPRPARPWFAVHAPRFAAAAAALAVLAGAWWIARPSRPAWQVQSLAGAPKVGWGRVQSSARLAVGAWLETDDVSRAKVSLGTVGEVEVDPNTKLRLLRARRDDHRLALARGTVHAVIWARPRLFFIETPSALVVDLGCAYTLTVDEDGGGRVRVTAGWVAFDSRGRETVIPSGAVCLTRPEVGPGTPYFEDATEAFRAAVTMLDFGAPDEETRTASLGVLLAEARARDAFTLWHLLNRGDAAERRRVFDRMAELVPPPAGVTRDGVLARDPRMLDAWWDSLGLGETTWWRMWKKKAPAPRLPAPR